MQGLRAGVTSDRLPQGKGRGLRQHLQGVLLRGTERSPLPTQNWGGGKTAPFSDPDFANMSIGEVVRLMGRAKQWLESRGCRITLHGDFIETKTRKLKFE